MSKVPSAGSLWQLYPELDAQDPIIHAHLDHLKPQVLPGGTELLRADMDCAAIPFVISGTIQVYQTGEHGRYLSLYSIGPGESCVLSTSCVIGKRRFPAWARTESDTVALLVPAQVFHTLMDQSPSWRTMVFALLSGRLAQVIALTEAVAFQRLDQRLATTLLQVLHGNSDTITMTHQDLASRLGSSREVISRLLKDFEHQGIIEVGRGTITILNPQGLHKLANN